MTACVSIRSRLNRPEVPKLLQSTLGGLWTLALAAHDFGTMDPEEEGKKEEGEEAEEQQRGGRKRSQAGEWTLRLAREWQKWADCVDVEPEEE